MIHKLLANEINRAGLGDLRRSINPEDLSFIIQKIYDLNETYILKLAAVEGGMERMNRIKNRKRNARFLRAIRRGFREPEKGATFVVLAEGDSWFNYPIILTDLVDHISRDPDLAVYSIASGGDWLLNMLTAREYVQELSVLHPDVFLISAGGNDLVGSRRLASILDPGGGCAAFEKNPWARRLVRKAEQRYVPFRADDFAEGCRYLSKDFFALLMFFHLQYYSLMKSVLLGSGTGKESKFPGIRILTQGYDYPVPSYAKCFGLNPVRWYRPFIRTFLGHGSWLKTPMQLRGINDPRIQECILYSMIYLFNEMMIEMRSLFPPAAGKRIFHIDSRGSVERDGWSDELHPEPAGFRKTGKVFIGCIKKTLIPTYDQVFVVSTYKV